MRRVRLPVVGEVDLTDGCDDGTLAEVTPLLPNWPWVRCDACNRIFEVGEQPRRCPACGHDRFSTRMDGLPVEMQE